MRSINSLTEEKLNLERSLSAIEKIVDASEGSGVLSKDLGAFFEDLSERLNDLSTRIAHAHRQQSPVIEQAVKRANGC